MFLSADEANPAKLVDGGLADGAAVNFAGNELVIIVPTANPAAIATPADLANAGVKIIAAGADVPITKYATQSIANLAGLGGYPAGFAAAYDTNIVSKEDNVKAVVAKIELGEGDAAIVYVTDAKASTKVKSIEIPAAANVPASYAGVVVKASAHKDAAHAYLTWLAGPDGQAGPGPLRVPATAVTVAHRPSRGLVALTLPLVLFLAVPVVGLVARALLGGGLLAALASPVVLDALRLSVVTTAVSLGLTLAFGTPLAYLLARRSFRGSSLVETVVDLPIVLPPSVAGLALLFVFGRQGLLGGTLDAFGISIPFTTFAVVLAQTFVAAPFYIRSARAGIAGVDRDIEDAARVDGASERQVFRWVTASLAGTALAAGAVMSWSRALGEFGATIMFAGNIEGRTQTLPLVVYSEFGGGDLDASVAAAAILVLAAFGVLVSVRVLRWGRALDIRGG